MRARGLRQVELAARLDWTPSALSRIVVGKSGLTPYSRSALARALECREANLTEPVGSPIPPPMEAAERLLRNTGQLSVPGFEQRLATVLRLLGVESVGSLVLFLMAGNYSELPEETARRFRRVMEGPEGAPLPPNGEDADGAQ
jgi:hypothetical protein